MIRPLHRLRRCRSPALLLASALLAAACTSPTGDEDAATTTSEPTTTTQPATTQEPTTTSTSEAAASNGIVVVGVIDGDTFDVEIDGVVERVRLIGINAPERGECFADDATAALTDLLDGDVVELETDTSDRDDFGRLLRYVMVDGEHVNERLVHDGFVIAQRYPPDTARSDELDAAQAAAQADGNGLWTDDACGESVAGLDIVVDEIEFDAPGDDSQNLNGEWVVLRNASDETIDLTGWVLRDESASNRYSFPDGFELAPDATVQVFSGCGDDTAEELFWCASGSAIWNNSGDTVFVLDPNGTIVTSTEY